MCTYMWLYQPNNQWVNITSDWLHNYRMNGTYIPRNYSVIYISQLSSYWTKIISKYEINAKWYFYKMLVSNKTECNFNSSGMSVDGGVGNG